MVLLKVHVKDMNDTSLVDVTVVKRMADRMKMFYNGALEEYNPTAPDLM